jgi:hypothetical protein
VTMKSQNNPNVVVPPRHEYRSVRFGDSDNRYGFVTKIIHMAALSPYYYKMQYIAHRGYSQNIKTIV